MYVNVCILYIYIYMYIYIYIYTYIHTHRHGNMLKFHQFVKALMCMHMYVIHACGEDHCGVRGEERCHLFIPLKVSSLYCRNVCAWYVYVYACMCLCTCEPRRREMDLRSDTYIHPYLGGTLSKGLEEACIVHDTAAVLIRVFDQFIEHGIGQK
jgi:hypothetical protein